MDENQPIKDQQKELLVIENFRKELLRGLFILLLVSLVFLFLRILLKLIGANPENIFTGFIYIVSGIFLLPFFGILPEMDNELPGEPSVDTPAFIAFFCYIVLILLAMAVIQIGSMIMRSNKKVKKTLEEERTIDTTVVDDVVE
jgi:hypothetical protein